MVDKIQWRNGVMHTIVSFCLWSHCNVHGIDLTCNERRKEGKKKRPEQNRKK